MKKTWLHFFFKLFKKFRKCLESWKRRLKFSLKSGAKKIFVTITSIIMGSVPPPPYLRFRRGLRPIHPLQGLLPPELAWQTIDWNSNQLVLMYYWSTFLNQVRFLNFRHFYDPIFKLISQASFFLILTIFWLFIHCEEEK